MKYEVTIGIPVYNVEKYIRRAMDSALAQTFASIEILILDDCGTDSSIDIVREYQKTHPRGKDIRIVSQPYNKGIGEARNRIVDEAQGQYLFFMDADDSISPNAIEILYNASKKYNAEVVYGSYQRIEEYGEKTNNIFRKYTPTVYQKENEFAEWAYEKYNNLQAMIWNILFRIDIFRKNNLHYQPINYMEDLVFTIDLPVYVTHAVLLEDITYYYYCREGSASKYQKRTYIEKREIESTIGAMRFLKKNCFLLREKPYFPQRMNKILKTCYYIAQYIIKNKDIIDPPFNKKEIRNVIRMPLIIFGMFKIGPCMLQNILLFLLGEIPPSLSVWLIRKRK